MEYFEITITLPTMQSVVNLLIYWFCFGVVFNVVHAFAFVACDYGRTSSRLPWYMGMLMVFVDSFFWPANIKSIRDNLSASRFNRSYNHYR